MIEKNLREKEQKCGFSEGLVTVKDPFSPLLLCSTQRCVLYLTVYLQFNILLLMSFMFISHSEPQAREQQPSGHRGHKELAAFSFVRGTFMGSIAFQCLLGCPVAIKIPTVVWPQILQKGMEPTDKQTINYSYGKHEQ